jgi:hypothetical protein
MLQVVNRMHVVSFQVSVSDFPKSLSTTKLSYLLFDKKERIQLKSNIIYT